MNQYLYQIRLKRLEMLTEGPTESETNVLQDHVSYLERLAQESVVLLAGRTQTVDADGFGIVILRAGSEREAQQIMEQDPGVKDGVMHARLFPYKIAVLSDAILENQDDPS